MGRGNKLAEGASFIWVTLHQEAHLPNIVSYWNFGGLYQGSKLSSLTHILPSYKSQHYPWVQSRKLQGGSPHYRISSSGSATLEHSTEPWRSIHTESHALHSWPHPESPMPSFPGPSLGSTLYTWWLSFLAPRRFPSPQAHTQLLHTSVPCTLNHCILGWKPQCLVSVVHKSGFVTDRMPLWTGTVRQLSLYFFSWHPSKHRSR